MINHCGILKVEKLINIAKKVVLMLQFQSYKTELVNLNSKLMPYQQKILKIFLNTTCSKNVN